MALFHGPEVRNQPTLHRLFRNMQPLQQEVIIMGMGRGLLLWMLGIPLPIIILLALFWH